MYPASGDLRRAGKKKTCGGEVECRKKIYLMVAAQIKKRGV